jgi:hypothetical protein
MMLLDDAKKMTEDTRSRRPGSLRRIDQCNHRAAVENDAQIPDHLSRVKKCMVPLLHRNTVRACCDSADVD